MSQISDSLSFRGSGRNANYQRFVLFSLVALQVLLTKISMEEILHLYVLESYTLTTLNYL